MTKANIKVVKVAPPKPRFDEAQRLHRAINWVISVVLLVFAIWSIVLNAEGRSLYKQTVSTVAEMDKKLSDITSEIKTVRDLCQQTTVVIPTATIDGAKNE